MAITIDDFAKVWASQSPLTPYEFSESNYKEGWNFIGGTPPSRQMWDFLQKNNDEKMKYLADNIQALANILVPIGVVQAYAGNTVPDGWLLCDGSAVSRTDYADLYAVIGDTYGAGDGSTTFNLPNLTDKFIQGNATSGTEHSAGLPNITGDTAVALDNMGPSGAFVWLTSSPNYYRRVETMAGSDHFGFDASKSNSIYGNSTTVQPPSLTMRYIIKY